MDKKFFLQLMFFFAFLALFAVGFSATAAKSNANAQGLSFAIDLNGPIACYSDSNCGSPIYSANRCSIDGNVVRDKNGFACVNAGTPSAYCQPTFSVELVQVCTNGCSSGACILPPIACYSDADCGSTTYSGSYCSGDNVVRDVNTPACTSPGTPSSYCSSSLSTELVEACAYGCSASYCVFPQVLKVKSDSLDGQIIYRNGSFTSTSALNIQTGHDSTPGSSYWKRAVMEFNLSGAGSVRSAKLFLDYYSKRVKSETCAFDLYSVQSLGAGIDSSDWGSTVFEKAKDNWFDQSISGDISADITSAWNSSVDAGRNFLAFRIAMDDESSYTSKKNYCAVTFNDTNSGLGVDPYIVFVPQ